MKLSEVSILELEPLIKTLRSALCENVDIAGSSTDWGVVVKPPTPTPKNFIGQIIYEVSSMSLLLDQMENLWKHH